MTATDDLIERILRDDDTITVVGAGVDPARPAIIEQRRTRISRRTV